jgi:hypothetical protein
MADERESQRQKNHRKVVRQQEQLAMELSPKDANLEKLFAKAVDSMGGGGGYGFVAIGPDPTGGLLLFSISHGENMISTFTGKGAWSR